LAAEYVTVAQSADCPTCYLTTDPLGSTRVITDGSGNVVSRHDYYPFGEELATSNRTSALQYGATDYVAQRFTGKERDAESALDYFGARYYASTMGRFMSPDWAAKAEPVPYSKLDDPQPLNLYTYVRNNPLSGVDPDGHYFVVSGQDQKFYQQVLTDLYRRPGGRDLVNSLANSDRPVILDRRSLDTADTGTAGVTNALAISGQAGVAGAHVTVGTDTDLAAGAKMAPGQVSADVTTGHELEHANDGITAGQNSLQAGSAAMAAGDAPSSPGAHNTVGGTAQSRAEDIMGQKTDMNKKDAGAAVQGILSSGQQQWQNSTNRSAICSQNQGACH
jgi:RHS repeat-associated protein